MKSLYLILDILTILFPLLLSFDKKVAFYKSWKGVFWGFIIVGLFLLSFGIFCSLKWEFGDLTRIT